MFDLLLNMRGFWGAGNIMAQVRDWSKPLSLLLQIFAGEVEGYEGFSRDTISRIGEVDWANIGSRLKDGVRFMNETLRYILDNRITDVNAYVLTNRLLAASKSISEMLLAFKAASDEMATLPLFGTFLNNPALAAAGSFSVNVNVTIEGGTRPIQYQVSGLAADTIIDDKMTRLIADEVSHQLGRRAAVQRRARER
jgi:hypothetical protein